MKYLYTSQSYIYETISWNTLFFYFFFFLETHSLLETAERGSKGILVTVMRHGQKDMVGVNIF